MSACSNLCWFMHHSGVELLGLLMQHCPPGVCVCSVFCLPFFQVWVQWLEMHPGKLATTHSIPWWVSCDVCVSVCAYVCMYIYIYICVYMHLLCTYGYPHRHTSCHSRVKDELQPFSNCIQTLTTVVWKMSFSHSATAYKLSPLSCERWASANQQLHTNSPHCRVKDEL